MSAIHTHLRSHRKSVIAVLGVVAVAGTSYAAYMKLWQHTVPRDTGIRETRMNVIIKVPYGSVGVYAGAGPNDAAVIETQTDGDEEASMHARYLYNPVGTIGTLRITLGSDEGMLDRPKEFASGSWASSGYSLASAGSVQTDGGTYRTKASMDLDAPSPSPAVKSDNEVSRIFLNPTVPISLYAELGFGESVLDMSNLSVMAANIQTSASRTRISSHTPNRIPMDNCTVSAGLGECVVDGICNFNCKTFGFSGGIGYYELHFTGNLQQNLDAKVEVACGKIVINIPPEAGRVQVEYEDNLLSSFSFQGLNKRRDGYYTSVGFEQSRAPVLTLHLLTGVGKMVVNYH